MSVFADYANFYDLLYREKDYISETSYVVSLLRKYVPVAESLLEIGCGTAAYTEALLKSGYVVDGLDISPEMIKVASERIKSLPEELSCQANLIHGDARVIDLGRTYEAIVSLFHVLSYQQTNDDVEAFMRSIARHLQADGVAVFDFWYGPAVLIDRPSVRVKRCEDESFSLTRIAEPEMRIRENLVEVRYELIAENHRTGSVQKMNETHVMRYFFLPELENLLDGAGMTLLAAYKWMNFSEPDERCWNVCVVAKKC